LSYTFLAFCLKWHAFGLKSGKVSGTTVILRVTFIVMTYVVFWSVALVGRLQNYVLGREEFQYHLISLTSSGICNFVVWGISSPKIYHQWLRLVNCCRIKKKQPIVPPGMLPSDVDLSIGGPPQDDYPASVYEGGEEIQEAQEPPTNTYNQGDGV